MITEKIDKIKEVLLKHGFQYCTEIDKYDNGEEFYTFFDKTWSPEKGGAKYMIWIDEEYLSCRDISNENFHMGMSVFGYKTKKLSIEKLDKKLSNLF